MHAWLHAWNPYGCMDAMLNSGWLAACLLRPQCKARLARAARRSESTSETRSGALESDLCSSDCKNGWADCGLYYIQL